MADKAKGNEQAKGQQKGTDKVHGGSGRGDNKGDRADANGAGDSRSGARGPSSAQGQDNTRGENQGGLRSEGRGGQGGSGNKTAGGGGSKKR